jgi:hypothetical protein
MREAGCAEVRETYVRGTSFGTLHLYEGEKGSSL